VIRRALSYLSRPEIRAQPALLVGRRTRYELAKARGGAGLRRDRVVAFDGDLRIGVRFTDKIERSIYLYGLYEFHTTQAFLSLLRPGMTFVDGGAHVGHYTLLAAKRVGPEGRVVAFEPEPRNRERLERNVALNDFSQVAVLPFALFDREGEVAFARAPEGDTGTGAISANGAIDAVNTVRLDDIFAREGIERLDVLKLDIEGAEAPALAGAAGLLERARPAVLFEVNRIGVTNDGVSAPALDVLRGHGYRLYAIESLATRPHFALTELPAGVDPRPHAERWYALNLIALHPDAHSTLR
jgi:FkbM family methyltransferase